MSDPIDIRTVRIARPGGPEVLELVDSTLRAPGPGEVRVRVVGAGLNRADVLQRKGHYPAPRGTVQDVPGLEYAGVVEALGEGAEARVGDRVMGIVAGGGMASHVVVHARELLPVPDTMSLIDAAALPEVALTVFDALVVQGGLTAGHAVLIHAVGSGIGTAAAQLVRAYHGVSIGTSRDAGKLPRALALGLDHGVHVEGGAFAPAVKALAPSGCDLVLDTVGAAYLEQNVDCLAPSGTIVTIGLLGGVKGTLPLGALLAKRARVVGSTLRARPLEEKIALARRARRELLPLVRAGALRPVVDRVFPAESVAEAHTLLESNSTFGKLVLRFGDEATP